MRAHILSPRARVSNATALPARVNPDLREFVIPDNFDALQLPPALWASADEARYLVDLVRRKAMSRRRDRNGFSRLQETHLRRFVSPRHLAKLEHELTRMDVLEVDHSYHPEVRSKGFRLTPESLSARHLRVRPTSPILIEKLRSRAAEIARIQEERSKPIHRKLNEIQNSHLTIVQGDAERILRGLRPTSQLCQGVLVENLVRRTLTNSISSTGRWFNAITGIKKELRGCLRLDAEQLGAIDLECCQVALLGLLIHANLTPGGWKGVETYKVALRLPVPLLLPCCDDRVAAMEFVELASSGLFYDALSVESGLSRSEAKRRFLVDVLAPRKPYPCIIREVFERRYSGVAAFVRALNDKHHSTLIRMLQRMESRLVVETMCPRLVERIPIVPLHDAIYARQGDVPLVEEAFEDVFSKIGYRIAMRREVVGTDAKEVVSTAA